MASDQRRATIQPRPSMAYPHQPERVTSAATVTSSGPSDLSMDGMGREDPVPGHWREPKEYNMEIRESFKNWKKDVQAQIAKLGSDLDRSLQLHPRPGFEPTTRAPNTSSRLVQRTRTNCY